MLNLIPNLTFKKSKANLKEKKYMTTLKIKLNPHPNKQYKKLKNLIPNFNLKKSKKFKTEKKK